MSHDSCNHADIETPLEEALITLDPFGISEIKHGRMRVAHFHGSNLKHKLLTVFLASEKLNFNRYKKEIDTAELIGNIALLSFTKQQLDKLQSGKQMYFEITALQPKISVLVEFAK